MCYAGGGAAHPQNPGGSMRIVLVVEHVELTTAELKEALLHPQADLPPEHEELRQLLVQVLFPDGEDVDAGGPAGGD